MELDWKDKKLKPCPMCGSQAKFEYGGFIEFHGHEHNDAHIECTNKDCNLSLIVDAADTEIGRACSCCHDLDEIAIDRWNRRA